MKLFFEHFKKDHLLSGIDARIKLIVAIVLLLLVVSYKGFAFPLIVSILGFGLCLGMKIPLRVFALRFSEPIFIVLVLVALKCFFSGRDVIFSFNVLGLSITGHKDGQIGLGFGGVQDRRCGLHCSCAGILDPVYRSDGKPFVAQSAQRFH